MTPNKKINYSQQNIDKNDILAVNKILKSTHLTQSGLCRKVENNISKIVGSKYCSLVNSGSNALHLACLTFGLKKGDLVWTVPNTYAATINAPIMCGAKIDFVDIELDTFNICIKSLKKKLQNNIPKLLIVVHIAGQSPDMEEIYKLSKKYDFFILKDASHSFGGQYRGKLIGCSKYSDITIFSFHPLKTITSGEGGALTTNSNKFHNLIKLIRENGILKNSKKRFNSYDQIQVGLNYRLSDINTALLDSQLKKFRYFVKIRNKITNLYNEHFKDYDLLTQKKKSYSYSSCHLYIIVIKKYKKNLNKDKLINLLMKKYNIYTTTHYPSLNKFKFLKKKFIFKKYKNSEFYSNNAISIPIHTKLTSKDISNIIKILKNYLNKKVK